MKQNMGAPASGPGSREPSREGGSAAVAASIPSREWIGWFGGVCPLAPDTLVDVKWNNGAVSRSARAGLYAEGDENLWVSRSNRGHIVAYRLAQEPPDEEEVSRRSRSVSALRVSPD